MSTDQHRPVAELRIWARSFLSRPRLTEDGCYKDYVEQYLSLKEDVLDAEIHGFRDANHGDGEEHVVADLDGLSGADGATVCDVFPHHFEDVAGSFKV